MGFDVFNPPSRRACSALTMSSTLTLADTGRAVKPTSTTMIAMFLIRVFISHSPLAPQSHSEPQVAPPPRRRGPGLRPDSASALSLRGRHDDVRRRTARLLRSIRHRVRNTTLQSHLVRSGVGSGADRKSVV